MSNRPTTRNWISILVMGISLIAVGQILNHSNRDLPATTTARLDDHYNRVSSHRGETVYYEVTYTFTVGDRQYHGSDDLHEEPSSELHQVFYNPRDPADNALTSDSADGRKLLAALVLGIVAIIAYATLPVSPYGQNTVYAVEGSFGDSAGEYLTMEAGKFSASVYVGAAFFVQLAMTIGYAAMLLMGITGGHVSADVLMPGAVIFGLGLTLLIYWDRWKCTTIYCSRYCSGCANISVAYVPLIAFFYANYRGLMKLKGK